MASSSPKAAAPLKADLEPLAPAPLISGEPPPPRLHLVQTQPPRPLARLPLPAQRSRAQIRTPHRVPDERFGCTILCWMQVVCVTGVSGYIASWLVKLLLHHGNTVRSTVRDTVGCWLLVGPHARPAGIHRFSHSSGRPRSPWCAAPRARWWPSWCRRSPTALATCGCSTRRTTAGSPGWSLSLIS